MAVTASTNNPTGLLEQLRSAIRDNHVKTWQWVQEVYLTHSPSQWANLAFFRPQVQHGALVFYIWPPQGSTISPEVYAIYHGRLIEMLLSHLNSGFTQLFASASPITGDLMNAQ